MLVTVQISLPNACVPSCSQLLSDPAHLNLQQTLNVLRQLRVIPVACHIRSQVAAAPPSAVAKQRNITRRMPTSAPVRTRLLTRPA